MGVGSATTHTPVFYYYSEEEYAEYFDSNGSHLIDVDDILLFTDNETIDRIDVYLKNSVLKAFTIIDLPGTGFNEDDNKTMASVVANLDVAILLATDVKEFTSSSSFYTNTLKKLKVFSIPYYFFLNCTSITSWSPRSLHNIEIANSDLVLLQDYEPLFIDNDSTHVINLMWYWCSQVDDTDYLYKEYYDSIQSHFDAKKHLLTKHTLEEASNFKCMRSIFGEYNRAYLQIKKEIKKTAISLKDEVCPIGAIQSFAFSSVPAGWLACDGSIVQIADYPSLYAVIGDTFGKSVNGTFLLPDLRGRFIRGLDEEGTIDTDKRVLGSFQQDSIQGHGHQIKADDNNTSSGGSHDHRVYFDNKVPGARILADNVSAIKSRNDSHDDYWTTSESGSHKHSLPNYYALQPVSLPGESINVSRETRPKNIALLYCIKAESTSQVRMNEERDNLSLLSINKIKVESLTAKNSLSFKKVSHFSEGRVRCLEQEGWIYLTFDGKHKKHYQDARDFSEKRAAVMMDGKWGFIDYDERLVIPCIYSKVGSFSEGVAYYEKPIAHGGKYTIERGFINYEGNIVLSLTENYSGYGLQFDDRFNYGLFKIYSQVHAEWINHEGKIVQKYQGKGRDGSNHDFSVEFGSISDWIALGSLSIRHVVHYSPQNAEEEQMSADFFGAFTEYETIHLRFDVKRNIIETYDGQNHSTEIEMPPIVKELCSQYSTIYPFVSTKWKGAFYNRARVQKKGFCGFIDELGKEIIPCVFTDVQNYSEGYAAVCKDNVWFFIDVFGNPLE